MKPVQSEVVPESGTKVIVLTFCIASAMAISMSGVLSSAPLLAEVFATPLSNISFVFAFFGIPSILFAPIAGLLIDRYGRKAVLIPALVIFCIGGTLCGFAVNLPMLVAMRFVQGIGACALGILQTTLLADSFTGERMKQLVGMNMAVFSITAALSPTLGGFLAQVNWRLPFLFPTLYCFLIPLAWNMKLAKPATSVTLKEYITGIRSVLTVRRTQALVVITFLAWCLAFGTVLTTFPALAHSRFFALPSTIGFVMLFYSSAMALASSRLGQLLHYLSPRHIMLVSAMLQFVALFFMPQVPALYWIIIPILFFGLGQGMIVPTVQSQLLQAVPTSQRGSLMALNIMLQRAGVSVGPVLFTSVLEWQGFAAPFYLGMLGVLLLAALVFFFISSEVVQKGA